MGLDVPQVEKPSEEASKANKTKDEEREVGGVSKQAYFTYFSYQLVLWIVAIASILLFRSTDIGQNFWLAKWSDLAGTGLSTEDTQYYLWVYTIITVVGAVLLIIQEWFVALAGLRTGRSLYATMIQTLSNATMKFFDTTPKGRIISRLSSDTDNVRYLIYSNTTLLSLTCGLVALPVGQCHRWNHFSLYFDLCSITWNSSCRLFVVGLVLTYCRSTFTDSESILFCIRRSLSRIGSN